jgi:hypothetical protein
MCFKSPKLPDPKPAPPPPDPRQATFANVAEQRLQAARAASSGRRSTMLTSLSDSEAGAPVLKKKLLGE